MGVVGVSGGGLPHNAALHTASPLGEDARVLLRARALALVVVLPGCFHPNYDHVRCGTGDACPSGLQCSAQGFCELPGGGGTDAGSSTGSDGGSSAPPDCFGHWMDGSVVIDGSTVKEITELSSTGQDLEPWISNDGLRMYFSRDLTPPGPGDIYFASRNSPTGTFGMATAVTNLNTTGHEARAWLTSDELTVALSTTRDGPLSIDMATRGAGQPFATPDNSHLAMVNAQGSERVDPFLTDDLLRLYFSANTGPGGEFQLWIAARSTAADDFDAPSLVPGINDNSLNEFVPTLYRGERLLVFSSYPNNATVDMYYATRSSATGSFGTAAQIPTVNTSSNEIGPVLSHDGCELYFASDRDADQHYHLFHARVTN